GGSKPSQAERAGDGHLGGGAASAAVAAGAAAKGLSAAAPPARGNETARTGARPTSFERRQGPRRIRVSGKAARRRSPDKPRDNRGPPRGPGGGRSPKKGVGTSGSALVSRGTPKGRQGPSPKTSGAGGAIAAAQRSWGRSGSWYEPRRRGMSQTSVAASSFPSQTEEAERASDGVGALGGGSGVGKDEDDEAAIGGGGGGRNRSVPTPPPSEVMALQQQQQQQEEEEEEALLRTPDAKPVAELAAAVVSSKSRSRSRSRESERSRQSRAYGSDHTASNDAKELPAEDMYFNRKKKQGTQARGRADRRRERSDRSVPDVDDNVDEGGSESSSGSHRGVEADGLAEALVRQSASSGRSRSGSKGTGKGAPSHDGMSEREVAAAEARAEAEASKKRSSYSRSIAAASKAATNPGYADSACGSVLVLDRASGKGFSVPNPYDFDNEVYRSGGTSGTSGGGGSKSVNKMAMFGSAVRSAVSGRGEGGRSRRDRSDSTDRSPRANPSGNNGDPPEKEQRRRRRRGGRQQDQEQARRPSSPAGYVHTAEGEARRRQE
ncbi:unnamed protein product, partial [Scytosiphon promiscuus]